MERLKYCLSCLCSYLWSHRFAILLIGIVLVIPSPVHAQERSSAHGATTNLLWIALILLSAKFGGLIERLGQPAVLGELLAGVVLGNLTLVGITALEPLQTNAILAFLAELGVIILLFQIGLESSIQQMRSVGGRALLVAVVGVITPFALGTYVVGPLLLPGLSSATYLFLGATLTATSVGITARVFHDLGQLQSREAQIVLGAAVIDDILGLIILAIVSAIVTAGSVSMGTVALVATKAVLFLIGAVLAGQSLARHLGRVFSNVHPGIGMKFTLAISFGLIFAYLASLIGLAPIVGAFAAGLVLDPVYFYGFEESKLITDLKTRLATIRPDVGEQVADILEHHTKRHVEDLIEPVGHFLIPIFFVMTGMAVDLQTLFNPTALLLALGITGVAFAGKLVAGAVAGDVNKQIVGWGLVPRGEVGLIFAAMGQSLGVISGQNYSVIVITVILTTLLTPPILAFLIQRSKAAVPSPHSSTGSHTRPT